MSKPTKTIGDIKTIRDLLEDHPEMADLPVAIYRDDGTHHYLGWSGSVYIDKNGIRDKDEPNGPILVFSAD